MKIDINDEVAEEDEENEETDKEQEIILNVVEEE